MTRYAYTSVTRISTLPQARFTVAPLDRRQWATGDYVVGEVTVARGPLARAELASGRMAEVNLGDHLVGALAHRAATLEVVGSWEKIGDDLEMQLMTSAGLLGKATSWSGLLPRIVSLRYRGHVFIGGRKQRMVDFVESVPEVELTAPVILLIGTSMSAGKTTTAKVLVRLLEEEGRRVVGAKITGAGRYRDILSMADAGAAAVFDFVEVGLPSTICPEEEYRPRLRQLLSRIAAAAPEVVVAEAGASPLEPYNGAAAIEELGENVRCTVLCASDPYAAVGVMRAFHTRPDFVTGVAANTTAGCELIEKLTGVPAINALDPATSPRLRRLLAEKLGFAADPALPAPASGS